MKTYVLLDQSIGLQFYWNPRAQGFGAGEGVVQVRISMPDLHKKVWDRSRRVQSVLAPGTLKMAV